MKNKSIFVTGIGTGVGKTVCSAILTQALHADYWKPVQAGDLHDTDSHKVKKWVSHERATFFSEQFALKHPMSPHAAAKKEDVHIRVKDFRIPETNKHLIIEGAGGLMVPINDSELILDLIPLEFPVILVSRNYLGSINHTLLSVAYLQQKGYKKLAILFNGDTVPTTESIISSKTELPVLGRIPFLEEITPDLVKKQAQEIQANLAAFLQMD